MPLHRRCRDSVSRRWPWHVAGTGVDVARLGRLRRARVLPDGADTMNRPPCSSAPRHCEAPPTRERRVSTLSALVLLIAAGASAQPPVGTAAPTGGPRGRRANTATVDAPEADGDGQQSRHHGAPGDYHSSARRPSARLGGGTLVQDCPRGGPAGAGQRATGRRRQVISIGTRGCLWRSSRPTSIPPARRRWRRDAGRGRRPSAGTAVDEAVGGCARPVDCGLRAGRHGGRRLLLGAVVAAVARTHQFRGPGHARGRPVAALAVARRRGHARLALPRVGALRARVSRRLASGPFWSIAG